MLFTSEQIQKLIVPGLTLERYVELYEEACGIFEADGSDESYDEQLRVQELVIDEIEKMDYDTFTLEPFGLSEILVGKLLLRKYPKDKLIPWILDKADIVTMHKDHVSKVGKILDACRDSVSSDIPINRRISL
jgi:hypothetical protein